MNSYLLQGTFAIPQARFMNFKGPEAEVSPEDVAVEIVWGLWEVPDSDNDDTFNPPPSYA